MTTQPKFAYWEKRDNVAWLYLDDPATRNALGSAVAEAVVRCIAEIEEDDEIGVVCLTSSHETSFSSGNNLKELARLEPPATTTTVGELHDGIRHCTRPVIAVVHGYCLGGGISLLANCDLAIASDQATFGLPEVVRGYPPGRALGEILQTIPAKWAFDLAMSGRNWPAERALAAGLISRIVPHDELLESAQKWASDMASFPPGSLRMTKTIMHRILDILPHDERVTANLSGYARDATTTPGIVGDGPNSIRSFFRHEEDTKARSLE